MKSGKLISALLIGAAAGAVIGILFAPDKGTETRKKIAKKTGNISDALKEKLDEFAETVADKYDSIRAEANEILEKTKEEKEQAI